MAVCTALALLSCSAPRSLAHGHCVCGHRVRGPRAHGLSARAVSEPGRGLGLAGVIARGPEGRRCGTRGSLSDRGSALLCRGLCVPAALSIFSEISKSGNFP